LSALNDALGIPLVLHGGSGIDLTHVREAATRGIAKMNIGTDLRQVWEQTREARGEEAASEALYARTVSIITDELQVSGSARRVLG
jgi:fructose/tagatose bisphosphate aldolase